MHEQDQRSVVWRVLYYLVSFVACLLLIGAAALALRWIYSSEPTAEREGATRKTAALVETLVVSRGTYEPELSVLGVRGADGEVVLYDAIRNEHVHHILDVSVTPSGLDRSLETRAQEVTRTILEGLQYVGVLCVEMFLAGDELLVNEIAPRPHNSGHLTIEGHTSSQFEQQVRAMCGLPLGSPSRRVPAIAMANLLGDLWTAGEPAWDRALAIPDTSLHLYGKSEARPKRKMGHITALGESPDQARSRALEARESLGEVVGVRGFEPPTSATRTQRSSKLSDTPTPTAERTLGGPSSSVKSGD